MIEDLKIKLADNVDTKDVFELSNDPIVRHNSFKRNLIDWQDHINWFSKKIRNEDSIFYVARTISNEFVGYVRFDKQSNNDKLDNCCIITIHLIESFRGKGIGGYLIKETSKIIFNDYNNLENIYAYVKKENMPSLKSFLKNGYEVLEECRIEEYECFKLVCKN